MLAHVAFLVLDLAALLIEMIVCSSCLQKTGCETGVLADALCFECIGLLQFDSTPQVRLRIFARLQNIVIHTNSIWYPPQWSLLPIYHSLPTLWMVKPLLPGGSYL